ncbi:uncharacterized protein C17orf67 homolog isoform 2-T2 [Anableps anableps]
MKKHLVVFLLCLVLLATDTDANPIIRGQVAKQLLRSKRQDWPLKAGHHDEPMRKTTRSDATRISRRHLKNPQTL